MTEWVVCNACHNVIEPHNCGCGANTQPWCHGTGTNWAYECPSFNRRQFFDRPCAYCGHTIRSTAPEEADGGVVPASRLTPSTSAHAASSPDLSPIPARNHAATAALAPQKGGENIMENIFITIDGVTHEFAEVTAAAAAAPTLTIKRPFVVYDVNGERVDGYKYESRARRNNDARFAGTGYFLGRADTGVFEFVSA